MNLMKLKLDFLFTDLSQHFTMYLAGWFLQSSFLFMLMFIGKDKRLRKVIYSCCEIKKSYNCNLNTKP